MHVLSKASLFWRGTSFLVLIHLQQAASSTSSPCASSQLVTCMGANLRAQACDSSLRQSCSTLKGQLMRTSPLSVVLVTTPSRSDHTVSLSCLTGTQLSMSVCSIIWSFLIFQCEFIGRECSYPTVSCHIQIWCCQHICQWIVVHTYCEWGVGQVFFEMFSDTPLQCQEFQFRAVIVLLQKALAFCCQMLLGGSICLLVSVTVLLQVLLLTHQSPIRKAYRSQGTPALVLRRSSPSTPCTASSALGVSVTSPIFTSSPSKSYNAWAKHAKFLMNWR